MTPEQPNTPELMAEYLIEKHSVELIKLFTKAYFDEHLTTYTTQSAIVSAEVGLERTKKLHDIAAYKFIKDEITFWEKTIKYLQSKL